MSTDRANGKLYAPLFSTAVIRALSRRDYLPSIPTLDRVIELADPKALLRDLFEGGFRVLEQEHRPEYVYKNAIVSKVVFGRHSPSTAHALIEQPMGDSIADVTVVNGTTTAYEIKTDLDDFTRVRTQLDDYSQHCEHVYLVTSQARAQQALAVADKHIGVIALRSSGALSVVRMSSGGIERLSARKLSLLLHQHELLTALNRRTGYVPDVPSGLLGMRMREMFATLPVEVAHAECVRALRARGTLYAKVFAQHRIPLELRALMYGTSLSTVARQRVMNRLNRAADEYTLTA